MEAGTDSISTGVKKSGFMQKLNNSGRLARRWCVLEKNRFKYWYTQPEAQGKDTVDHQFVDEFKITRQECFFSRFTAGSRGD